jgi:hypothetical protein
MNFRRSRKLPEALLASAFDSIRRNSSSSSSKKGAMSSSGESIFNLTSATETHRSKSRQNFNLEKSVLQFGTNWKKIETDTTAPDAPKHIEGHLRPIPTVG